MNNQKIKELIEKYDNNYNGVVYANDVLNDLETLLEPECKHDTGGNLTVDELIEVHNK